MVVSLVGSNLFMLDAELKKLVTGFVAEYSDLALERLDGEEVETQQIIDAVQSLPFLSAKKMVIVRNLSANKQAAENIEQIIGSVAESTELLIYEIGIDKRTAYYKALKKLTDCHEFNQLDKIGLAKWLVQSAAENGGQISFADAQYLVERVGTDQQILNSELQKLLIYDSQITRTNIDLLTDEEPQSKIFDLLDAAFAGQTAKALAIYEDQRLQKVEPQQIIGMLAWQLHAMALVKAAGQRSSAEIASQAKLNLYVVQKTQRAVNKLSLIRIQKMIDDLLQIDIKGKSSSLDLDEALKHYLFKVSE